MDSLTEDTRYINQTDGTSALSPQVWVAPQPIPNDDPTETLLPAPPYYDPENQLKTLLRLSALDLNVFPIKYGDKRPFEKMSWEIIRETQQRFHERDIKYAEYITTKAPVAVNLAILCGRNSNNLAVIDCDTKAYFNLLVTKCIQMTGQVFAVHTRKGGHLYFHCKGFNLKTQHYTELRFDIQAEDAYVVAPGSVYHDVDEKHGIDEWHHYRPHSLSSFPPTVTFDQIQSLVPDATLEKIDNNTRTSTRPRRKYQAYVEGGRNNALFGELCELLGTTYNQTQDIATTKQIVERIFEEEIRPKAVQSGLTPKEIDNTYKSAVNRFNPGKMTHNRLSDIALAKQLLAQHDWTTTDGIRQNASTQAVFRACIIMAQREHGKPEFRVANREISNLAQLSVSTTNKHLKILEQCQLIEFVRIKDRRTKTTFARLNRKGIEGHLTRLAACCAPTSHGSFSSNSDNNDLCGNRTLGQSPRLHEVVSVRISHTPTKEQLLAERTALGHRTADLYQWLIAQDTPLQVSQIVAGYGMSRDSINYHIRKLKKAQLVEHNEIEQTYKATADDQQIDHVLSGNAEISPRNEPYARTDTRTAEEVYTDRETRHDRDTFTYRVGLMIGAIKKFADELKREQESTKATEIEPKTIAETNIPQYAENADYDSYSDDYEHESELVDATLHQNKNHNAYAGRTWYSSER